TDGREASACKAADAFGGDRAAIAVARDHQGGGVVGLCGLGNPSRDQGIIEGAEVDQLWSGTEGRLVLRLCLHSEKFIEGRAPEIFEICWGPGEIAGLAHASESSL